MGVTDVMKQTADRKEVNAKAQRRKKKNFLRLCVLALISAAVGGQSPAKAGAPDKGRFDFYKILPGGEEPKQNAAKAPERPATPPARTPDAPKAADRPADKVASAEPSAAKAAKPGERLWLLATGTGIAPFLVAQLPRDVKLLQWARRDAETGINLNPKLSGKDDALLRKRLLKAHGEALGLGDVA